MNMAADPLDPQQSLPESQSAVHARQAEARRATAAVDAATGRRWCPTCVSYRPTEGGRLIAVQGGRSTRWKCGGCIARTTRQIGLIAARRTILDV